MSIKPGDTTAVRAVNSLVRELKEAGTIKKASELVIREVRVVPGCKNNAAARLTSTMRCKNPETGVTSWMRIFKIDGTHLGGRLSG